MTGFLLHCRFDLLFAVVSPIVTLTYCYINFDYDHDVLEINNEVLLPGSFERQARMLANPSEIFLFLTSFNALRIQSLTDFLLRIGMHLSFCHRFKRVVEVQVAQNRGNTMSQELQPIPSTTALRQTRVPRVVALGFALFGPLILLVTHKSIKTSTAACAAYLQCVVYAQRWNAGDLCPCLILIDADEEPRAWDEWVNPVDVTEIVWQLATSGDLQALQLINRQLEEIPDELQRCTNMRHMYVNLLLD